MSRLDQLATLGQAVWLDYIQRSFTTSGQLAMLVNLGLRGVTSNPSIFEKAIAASADYDEALRSLVAQSKPLQEVYESLVFADIMQAADVLRPVYDRTNGLDGYVSLEVDPTLAHDTEGTIAEGRRFFAALGRPNVMIKVPATAAGIPAVETLIGEGVNVNVTLIFSVAHYEGVAQAYLNGLDQLAKSGRDLSSVASVASFFVSRVDGAVDPVLQKMGESDLLGRAAIANAKVAYARFQEILAGERWQHLAARGARPQRVLWASTSTKDPRYPDTLYVDELIGADTVNTVPPATLEAFMDHGQVRPTLGVGLAEAQDDLRRLSALGIDLDAVTQRLQKDGVASFSKAFDALMASITEKSANIKGDPRTQR